MEATQRTLFDILDRQQRNCDRTDRELAARGVSELRRSVISLILGHPDKLVGRETVTLKITWVEAAEWVHEFANRAGLECDRSNVRRAVLAWEPLGVLSVRRCGPKTVIVFFLDGFNQWLDETPDQEELARLLWQERVAISTACDPTGPAVTACDPQMNEGMKEDHSFIPSFRDLPPLTPMVWRQQTNSELLTVIRAWWDHHGLGEKLKQQAELTAAVLVGAIIKAREASDPIAYFQKCRESPKPWLLKFGLEWIKKYSYRSEPIERTSRALSESGQRAVNDNRRRFERIRTDQESAAPA